MTETLTDVVKYQCGHINMKNNNNLFAIMNHCVNQKKYFGGFFTYKRKKNVAYI